MHAHDIFHVCVGNNQIILDFFENLKLWLELGLGLKPIPDKNMFNLLDFKHLKMQQPQK